MNEHVFHQLWLKTFISYVHYKWRNSFAVTTMMCVIHTGTSSTKKHEILYLNLRQTCGVDSLSNKDDQTITVSLSSSRKCAGDGGDACSITLMPLEDDAWWMPTFKRGARFT